MNQLDEVSILSHPNTISGKMSMESYRDLWLRNFPIALNAEQHKGKGSKQRYEKRLKELESWDTSNNKPDERAGKIEALKILLNN